VKTATKSKLAALRDELLRAEREDEESAQTEREHGDTVTELEADEPELERSHPGAERGEDAFG
jgi:hypothetical protein